MLPIVVAVLNSLVANVKNKKCWGVEAVNFKIKGSTGTYYKLNYHL
jgi:hypothetical protein